MYNLTPLAVCALVNDLDDIYWAAVLNGTIEEVFLQEQKTLVSWVIDEMGSD